MKKKFFIPAAIAALMGVGAFFGHANSTPDAESDLLLANAEALAYTENIDGTINCFWGILDDEDPFLSPIVLYVHSCYPCGIPHVASSVGHGGKCKLFE